MPRRESKDPQPRGPEAEAADILRWRVSEVLERCPGALEILITAGFAPLAQPLMRKALAPTVTLEQAMALRGLGEDEREALLAALVGTTACRT